MAVIAAQLATGAFGGQFSSYISTDLVQYDLDYWPPHDSIAGVTTVADVNLNLPVSTTPRAIDAQRRRSFFDDYYNRVHILPRALDIGNLVSTQVSEVIVWNAWLTPITLVSIEGIGEGMSIAGPDEFPMTFGALQIVQWDLSITPDGPASIDVTLTWNFSGIADVTLAISGVRVLVWPFFPNWRRSITERMAWHTDILESETRKEQRRAMRLSPRRSFSAELLVSERERSHFDVLMHGWGGRLWALPIWPDIQLLASPVALGATTITCSTEGRDFREGGLALLMTASDSEAVEIESIDSDGINLARPTLSAWPARTRLYPARLGRFEEQPRRRRLSDQALEVDARFLISEASDWPALTLPTYRGFPVYDARPDESDELSGLDERLLHVLDNASAYPTVVDSADASFDLQAHAVVLNGIEERSAFRSLLYTLRGRQVSMWIPTHADDLRLLESVGSASTAMTIQNIGYSRYGLGQLGRKDIRIELWDGSVFMRHIEAAEAIDAESEQISIDTAFGQVIEPQDVRRISFMMLARCNSDVVQIEHVTDCEGVAAAALEFVATRDDE